jgi:hypothetical protein
MANRFPLIVNTASGNSVQELPSGDFLDLSNSGIANSGNITVNASSYFVGNGSLLTGIVSSYGNANVVANLAALGSNPISTTGNGLGFGLGGIGTASRALVGVFTPPQRSGEFFGLWGMVYKSSAVVGVPLFSMVFAANRPLALGMLSAFFIIGLVLMVFCIDEQEGIEASGGGTRE